MTHESSNSPSISVLSSNTVFAVSPDIDPVKNDVGRVGNKMVPLGGIAKVQRTDSTTIKSNNSHQDGAQNQSIFGIQVIPNLTIAVKRTSTIDIDVFSTQFEKCCSILINLLEGIGLPVVRVIGELDISLDICPNLSARVN